MCTRHAPRECERCVTHTYEEYLLPLFETETGLKQFPATHFLLPRLVFCGVALGTRAKHCHDSQCHDSQCHDKTLPSASGGFPPYEKALLLAFVYLWLVEKCTLLVFVCLHGCGRIFLGVCGVWSKLLISPLSFASGQSSQVRTFFCI